MDELFEPVPTILSRKIEHEPTRKELASYAEAIDKLVSMGTHLIDWELKDITRLDDERAVISVFFRRILELLDSISILVKESSVDTAVNQLRALLELVLAFEFLLKESTERRCYCYLITDFYRRKILYTDSEISDFVPNLAQQLAALDLLIGQQLLSEVKSEYLSKMKINSDGSIKLREIKWYSLFSTINTLADLAKKLNRLKLYTVVYKISSNVTHGTDLFIGKFRFDEEIPALIKIRDPTEALEVVRMSFMLGEIACNAIAKRRNKTLEQDYTWWIQKCKKQHQQIALSHLYKG